MPTMKDKRERIRLCLEEANKQGKTEIVNRAISGKHISWKLIRSWYAELGLDWTAKPSVLSPTLRKHLEWAWNYSIALAWRDDYTLKEIARDISGGVFRGEDATDEDLLEDFARNYIDLSDGKLFDKQWEPELPEDENTLRKLLLPVCDKLREEDEL